MARASREGAIRRLAEEYETVTLQALGAIEAGGLDERYHAIKRFYLIYRRVIGLTYEQKVIINRVLLERGRMCKNDPEAVIDGMQQLGRELGAPEEPDACSRH
ncbi:hypothetical protein AB4Z01_15140 [Inquilinus sp. YAF38]|uniref:hypothetical protein n=1 Tax=Inquilinus sp. YAF38 TaxID=3233084 RepID=UPI003F90867F